MSWDTEKELPVWTLTVFDAAVKPHVVCAELQTALKAELKERFGEMAHISYDKTGAVFHLDLGGPLMADAQWVHTDLGGMTLAVLVRDVEQLFSDLSLAKVRTKAGKNFYKLHGWIHALVLTPEQRQKLLVSWSIGMPVLLEKAEVEAVEYRRRLGELAKHPNIGIRKEEVEEPKDAGPRGIN